QRLAREDRRAELTGSGRERRGQQKRGRLAVPFFFGACRRRGGGASRRAGGRNRFRSHLDDLVVSPAP
ncbi:hypothetical protein, partial [Ottowia sp.]|uniref:hypothetical protein n=1 Tax=Ottowia sp. TaxID=1898956 RepID=UPI002603057E